jgi:hypothetical protein
MWGRGCEPYLDIDIAPRTFKWGSLMSGDGCLIGVKTWGPLLYFDTIWIHSVQKKTRNARVFRIIISINWMECTSSSILRNVGLSENCHLLYFNENLRHSINSTSWEGVLLTIWIERVGTYLWCHPNFYIPEPNLVGYGLTDVKIVIVIQSHQRTLSSKYKVLWYATVWWYSRGLGLATALKLRLRWCITDERADGRNGGRESFGPEVEPLVNE